MGNDQGEMAGAGRTDAALGSDAWIFDAFNLASDRDSILRIIAILDEVIESGGTLEEAARRVCIEFSVLVPKQSLRAVIRWQTVRRLAAAAAL